MFLAVYPKFKGAQRYIREGLSKDDMSYEMKTSCYSGKIKGPVWDDTLIDTDKKGKPVLNHSYAQEYKSKEIVNAARFCDALVSVDEWEEGHGVESFYYAFHRTGFWTEEYKKHSKKVFDFVIQDKNIFGKCEGKHNFDEVEQAKVDRDSNSDESSDEESGSDSDELAGFALCETAHYELALMRHHIRNCTGLQSDKLWRDKVFMILNDDVQKMPKEIGAKAALKRSEETKMNWLHAICVVLATVDEWAEFIYNRQDRQARIQNKHSYAFSRLYDPDDFKPLVDISDRVSSTMKALISCGTFDDPQMSKVLACLTKKMESVARTFDRQIPSDFWDSDKPALFGGSRANSALSICQKLVKTYAEKFAAAKTVAVQPAVANASPPPQVAADPSTVHKSAPKCKKRAPQQPLDAAPQSKKTK
jgi:hypothetical protein